MYFSRIVATITIISYMIDLTSTEQCKANGSKIENEKQFSHIAWSKNNPIDNMDGTLLVNELASCVFTCKTSPHR